VSVPAAAVERRHSGNPRFVATKSRSTEEEAMDSEGASKLEEVAAYQSSEAKQARLQSMLAALLDDPILADVPRKPSLGDVDTLINLELGSAMRVTVVKLDNTQFGISQSHIFVRIDPVKPCADPQQFVTTLALVVEKMSLC
jgi:hypothetical protein